MVAAIGGGWVAIRGIGEPGGMVFVGAGPGRGPGPAAGIRAAGPGRCTPVPTGTGPRGAGPGSGGRTGAEGHGHGVLLAAGVKPGDLDLVAGVVGDQRVADVAGGADGLTAEGDDLVARGEAGPAGRA